MVLSHSHLTSDGSAHFSPARLLFSNSSPMPPTRSLTFLFLLLGILSPPCPLSLTGRSLSAGPGPPWLALSAGSCSLICPAVPSLLTLIIRVHGGIALWDSLPRSPRSPAWPAEDATLLGVDFRQYAGRWSVAADEIRRAPSLRGHSVPRLEHSGTSPQASDTRLRTSLQTVVWLARASSGSRESAPTLG